MRLCQWPAGYPPGHRDHDGHPVGLPVELESIIGAELMLQPRAGRGDADPLLQGGQRVL